MEIIAIEPGEILGVTGPSGSGKSSLCMLIPRLYDPEQGRVEIDGVDVRLYTLESLRSQIGLVAQDSGLFDLTVAENVSFGLADWTMDQVREACRAAEVEPDVLALRHGYDTAIGERGALLSGGQRRRLALARALIRSPRILILDEPFEGLDSRSAESIGRTILKLAAGRTIILVSHHDEHLRGCSRVIRMERGAIVRDRRIDLSREYGHG